MEGKKHGMKRKRENRRGKYIEKWKEKDGKG